jgi:Zn-finger nucleic acid-binding protein
MKTNIIVWGAAIAYSLYSLSGSRYGLRHMLGKKDPVGDKSSLLLACYLIGNQLFGAKAKQVDGLKYTAFLTVPDPLMTKGTETFMPAGALLVSLDLRYMAAAHLVGIGTGGGMDNMRLRHFLSGFDVEQVSLEGDFGQHFDLYAEVGQQVAARYILDPKAMADFVDFLHGNVWEIVGRQMYVVVRAEGADMHSVLAEAQRLLATIRPAKVEDLTSKPVPLAERTYGAFDHPLPCPVCTKAMQLADNIQTCPQGHGRLMFGRELAHARLKMTEQSTPVDTKSSPKILTCPNCNTVMQKTLFAGTKQQLDSCPKCACRWID